MPHLLDRFKDESLVRGAMRGEPRSLESLISRYQRKAYAIARAISLDPDAADDIVQEAYLLAIQNLPRLRVHASFGPWFLQIVRNTARKSLRQRTVPPSPGPTTRSVEELDTLEVTELRERVWSEVERLPESLREAVFLYYHEGRSVRQVAGSLGLSNAAVKKRLQSGREILSARLWRALEDTLRDLLPSVREWKRTGRRLTLITVAALSTGRPAEALAGSMASASAAGGLKALGGLGALGGGWIVMKNVVIGAIAAAGLVTGVALVWFTHQTESESSGSRDVERSALGPSAEERRLALDLAVKDAENARLAERVRELELAVARAGGGADPGETKPGATEGNGETGELAAPERSGIDWSRLSRIVAQNVDLIGSVRASEPEVEFDPTEQALLMRMQSEFMTVAAAAHERSAHPIFDPVIFNELTGAILRESMGLDDDQWTRLAASNEAMLVELLGGVEPGDLPPAERFRVRQEMASTLDANLERLADAGQLARWELLRDFSEAIVRGPVKTGSYGLSMERQSLLRSIAGSWQETFHLRDEQVESLGAVIAEYAESARSTLESYAADQEALKALPAERQARLDEDLYEIQRHYDAHLEGLLDEEQREAYMKGPPSIMRFDFGSGVGISHASGVF